MAALFPPGPNVSTTYPLGYFREDYEFVAHAEPFYLDEHNGRFCVTPEYPNGTYAYFCYGGCQLEFSVSLRGRPYVLRQPGPLPK